MRKRPLAYINKEKDRWVVTDIRKTYRSFIVDSFHDARVMAHEVGWNAVRFKPWDS